MHDPANVHIEAPDGLGHDDLTRLAAQLRADGLPVEFAYDTMIADIRSASAR